MKWPLALYALFGPHIAVNLWMSHAGYVELTAFSVPAVLVIYAAIPLLVWVVERRSRTVGLVAFGATLLIWVPDFAHNLLLLLFGWCMPYPGVPGICG